MNIASQQRLAASSPSCSSSLLGPRLRGPSSVGVVGGGRAPLLRCRASDRAPEQRTQEQPKHHRKALAGDGGIRLSRRQLISTTIATSTMAMLASPPCECCSKLGLGLGAAQASNEWGYINDTQIQIQNRGPSGWKGICQYGEKQSPVDLSLKKLAAGGKGKLSDLIFNYKDVERTFVTNMGHGTPQVNFSEGNETIINGETYSLLQFHFHTPSEHAFDGQRFAMEAHLVHKSKTSGNFAVVGVMLEPSALRSNVCLGLALDNVPKVGGTTDIIPTPYLPHAFQMDPAALLPRPNAEGHRPYIHYQGSLTTPPCSEGVMWYVMTDPVLVGDSQILRFMKFVGAGKTYASNARPLQEYGDRSPLQYNDRPVLVSEDFSGRI